MSAESKVKIAHLAGPTATIQNSPPLVTSNKARRKYGLPPRKNPDGSEQRFDVLRAQRLAASAKVYVECFSAHPLEADAAELYGPPDGYLDAKGVFHKERTGPDDKAVFEIELQPDDGLYPLPYMARQTNGQAWEEECTTPGAAPEHARQGFYPDGSRSFEEIDRLSVGAAGVGNLISSFADVDFYRVLPTGGYTKGLPAARRTDIGEGDIPPEVRSKDFFAYKPFHIGESPARPALAKLTNATRRVLATGKYDGAIFTQGSPQVEETAYWLNLLMDTTIPICGNSAQRPHGEISNDGPKNLTNSVEYIASRVWADDQGRNRAGVIVLQEQQIFAAREVMKVDARPGGYVATGGHGGILGGMGYHGAAVLHYLPALKHTYRSEVNLSKIPASVPVVCAKGKVADAHRHEDQRWKRRLAGSRHSIGVDRERRRLFCRRILRRSVGDGRSGRAGRAKIACWAPGRLRRRGPDALWNHDLFGPSGGAAQGGVCRIACRARRPRQSRRLCRPAQLFHCRLQPDLDQSPDVVDGVSPKVRKPAASQGSGQSER